MKKFTNGTVKTFQMRVFKRKSFQRPCRESKPTNYKLPNWTFDSMHGIWHFFGLITFIWSVFQKCVSDRQARGLWQDNCFRNLKFFVISKEIKMLSFFYMHKSGYLIKFAFPVSKILSCPQNPFQSSKSLNSWQNETWWLLANIYFLRNKLYGS